MVIFHSYVSLPEGNSLPWHRWPIEIDGLPEFTVLNSMVMASMANWQCHNQMVDQ